MRNIRFEKSLLDIHFGFTYVVLLRYKSCLFLMTAYSLMFCVLFRKEKIGNQNVKNQDQSI